MLPILWTLGPFNILGHSLGPIHFYSYGLCLAVALGLSIYLFARDTGKYIAPKIGLTYQEGIQKAFDLGTWVIISSLVGARLFYVLENHTEFENGRWLDAVKIWQGGLVYYGGLFGALAAAYVWVRMQQWPMVYCFDLVAPYILLGQAIGRVGCFLNGCCYGIEDHVHGLVFPGAGDNLPHLPTQLWELYGDLTLFFLLLWVRRFTIAYGWLTFALYLICYGLLRYVVEIWRLDRSVHFIITFRSASQATSAALIVLGLALALWAMVGAKKRQR